MHIISTFVDLNEARRHPKIVSSHQIQNAGPNLKKKEGFEYNEYEYPTGNAQPVVEVSSETEEREPHEPHEQHEHHEQHESYLHSKSIHHYKKPGYSSGSGLRSIAQGSADQASSAVNNQVCSLFPIYFVYLFVYIFKQ